MHIQKEHHHSQGSRKNTEDPSQRAPSFARISQEKAILGGISLGDPRNPIMHQFSHIIARKTPKDSKRSPMKTPKDPPSRRQKKSFHQDSGGEKKTKKGGVVMAEVCRMEGLEPKEDLILPTSASPLEMRKKGIASLGGACPCLFIVVSMNVMGTKLENPERRKREGE